MNLKISIRHQNKDILQATRDVAVTLGLNPSEVDQTFSDYGPGDFMYFCDVVSPELEAVLKEAGASWNACRVLKIDPSNIYSKYSKDNGQ